MYLGSFQRTKEEIFNIIALVTKILEKKVNDLLS